MLDIANIFFLTLGYLLCAVVELALKHSMENMFRNIFLPLCGWMDSGKLAMFENLSVSSF